MSEFEYRGEVMKMKVIVSLLVIYIIFYAIPIQAQTNTIENTSNTYLTVIEDIDKTVTCNVTGNVFVVGTSGNITENVTDNQTENAIKNLIETQTVNATGKSENVTKLMTCNVTGKLAIIEDMVNKTESLVMIGKIDNMPGKVVIVGKMDKTGIDKKVFNMTGIEGKIDYMNVLMTGNMTGAVTCIMTENEARMTENSSNMTFLMKGNMTGTITGDMNKNMIKIKNMGNTAETTGNMISMAKMIGNMSVTAEPMKYNITGNMILIKSTNNMTETPETADNITDISRNIEEIKKMDQKMDNMTGMSENLDKVKEMDWDMKNMTGPEWSYNNSNVSIITVTNVFTNVINITQIGLS